MRQGYYLKHAGPDADGVAIWAESRDYHLNLTAHPVGHHQLLGILGDPILCVDEEYQRSHFQNSPDRNVGSTRHI